MRRTDKNRLIAPLLGKKCRWHVGRTRGTVRVAGNGITDLKMRVSAKEEITCFNYRRNLIRRGGLATKIFRISCGRKPGVFPASKVRGDKLRRRN